MVADAGSEASRRVVLRRLVALATIAALPGLAAGCGHGDGGMPMMGGSGSGQDWMMGGGGMMDPSMMADMPAIHDLLVGHEKIARTVEDVDGGIRATTTSTDQHLAELLRSHVAAMRARLEQNRPIRQGDPLFREIFKHHGAITLVAEEISGGVRVTETSSDPQVVLLIRQHARAAVSQFVSEGMNRAMRATPLPDGYRP